MTWTPKGIVIVGDAHVRNIEGITKGCQQLNIPLQHVQDSKSAARFADSSQWELFWFPQTRIDPQYESKFLGKKILYGPHFFIFPEGPLSASFEGKQRETPSENKIYTCLAPWNFDVFQEFGGLTIKTLPIFFGIDTDLFKPNTRVVKDSIFVYYKCRHSNDKKIAMQIAQEWNDGQTGDNKVQVHLIEYGKYERDHYRSILERSHFGIWVGCSESQGFALQEALSMNVPLLVWDVRSMYDQHDPHDKCVYEHYQAQGKALLATSAPSWDSSCGEKVFTSAALRLSLPKFALQVASFQPRAFVLKELSIPVCMNRLFQAFSCARTTINENSPKVMNYRDSVSSRFVSTYIQACKDAVANDTCFNTFRRDTRYCVVLEHVTGEQGKQYMEEIAKLCPELLHAHVIRRLQRNDSFGSPTTVQYINHLTSSKQQENQHVVEMPFVMSPTTLRYTKVVADFIHHFGDECLRHLDIVEIGGGYGGLNIVLQTVCDIGPYSIIDLPEVVPLAKKCVSKFPEIAVKSNFVTTDHVDEFLSGLRNRVKRRLCVSNYAFSACDPIVRTNYIQNLMRLCSHGYLTINYLNATEQRELEAALVQYNPERVCVRLAETPQTAEGNYILLWRPRVECSESTLIQDALKISQSQIGQDRFVLTLFGTRAEYRDKETVHEWDHEVKEVKVPLCDSRRCYLDVGCHAPVELSNTYVLEKLGWYGLGLDIETKYKHEHDKVRRNPMKLADVTTIDWCQTLESYKLPAVIDYLSMDVDEATLQTMMRFPFDKYKFRVLSVEHDRYRFGDEIASKIRNILLAHGYEILVKDICLLGNPFEDWWIHPQLMNNTDALRKQFQMSNVDFKEIFNRPTRQPSLSTTTTGQHLCIVSSTICPDFTAPLSFTATRSIYNTHERLQQTLETIESVRKFLPNAFILLADNSERLPVHVSKLLETQVNHLYRCFCKDTTSSPYKSLGESKLLLNALNEVRRLNLEFEYVFKLSGRYRLVDGFDVKRYCVSNRAVFYKKTQEDQVSTILYCVPKCLIHDYTTWLQRTGTERSKQAYMYEYSKENATYISQQGVRGRVAMDGCEIHN